MKTAKIVFLSIVLLFSLAGAQSSKKIKFEYDEFSNVSSLSLDEVNVKDSEGKRAALYFFVADTGKKLLNPPGVSMTFIQSSSFWQYLSCSSAYFIIDTARVSLGEGKHSGNAVGGGVSELLNYKQPMAFLEKLAKAQAVRFKICNSVFQIDEKNLEHIRAYHKQITDATQ